MSNPFNKGHTMNQPVNRRSFVLAAVPPVRWADAHHRVDHAHIGVAPEPTHISPAPGPPLWEDCDAKVGEGTQIEPDWDLAAQPALEFDVDQRVNW